jgi:hypothetical protein
LLVISVKDNGAGIAYRREEKKNTDNYISKGIDLTRKRIMLMYKNGSKKEVSAELANRKDGMKGAEFRVSFPMYS